MWKQIGKILILILVVVLAVFLMRSVLFTRDSEHAMSSLISQVTAEALPYEQEKADIRQELRDYEATMSESRERGRVMIGYLLSSYWDVHRMQEESTKYGFDPIVVLDCNMDEYGLSTLFSYLNGHSYEIVYTVYPFADDGLAKIEAARKYVAEYSHIDTNSVLLRGGDDTDANYNALSKAGYKNLLHISTGYENLVTETGLTCLTARLLNSRNLPLKSNLEDVVKNSSCYMCLFDMSAWSDTLDDNNVVLSYLDTIIAYTGDGSLLLSSVSDSFAAAKRMAMEKDGEDEAEEFIASRQARLKELDKITEEIYSKLEDERYNWDVAGYKWSDVRGKVIDAVGSMLR